MSVFFSMTVISMVILFMFIIVGVIKFGILPSYSAHSTKWLEISPKVSLWTMFTTMAAMLLVPTLIELGENNPLQFLGFFAPLYLIATALTPRWESNASEHKYHMIFAILCAITGIAWVIFVTHTVPVLLGVAAGMAVLGLLTGSLISARTFWAEVVAFLSVYLSILIAL